MTNSDTDIEDLNSSPSDRVYKAKLSLLTEKSTTKYV